MKTVKLVMLLSIVGLICSLSVAQPSGHETSRSMGAMYTSSYHPSNYDWLSAGYYRYPYSSYYRYYNYPYYNYPYYTYPNYYSYYPYSYYYYYGYPWYNTWGY